MHPQSAPKLTNLVRKQSIKRLRRRPLGGGNQKQNQIESLFVNGSYRFESMIESVPGKKGPLFYMLK